MLLRLTESSIRTSLSIFSAEKKVNCAENWKHTNETSIEPITQNQITQKVLWKNSKKSPVIDFFIGYLNKFAVDQSQM